MFRTGKFSFALLILLIVVPGLCWGSVYWVGGVAGVASWWLLQVFSIVGVVSLCVSLGYFMVSLIKRKKIRMRWISIFILAIISTWPMCWLLGSLQIAYPADVNRVKPAVTVRLPVKEAVLVGWGGDSLKTNYPHVVVPSERWAYDLLMKPAGMGSPNLSDYGIYGADVVAPAAGTIVEAYDDDRDHAPGTDEHESMAGNHIYIKLDETGTYLVIAHLMQNSIKVKAGDHVDEGALIAKAGNSGSSSEPHIHIHHQRQNPANTSLFLSEGLPLYFRDSTGNAMPIGGMRQEHGKDVPSGDSVTPL
ncbi:M23 family metallopeptidase [Paenibacillus sp. J22TS3]|uniref:M23 family metallopeptidase n=1 Tax=Paenibacillus sp. J22TS3 TaxID=2807192 RepID=UPI001B0B6EFF|nr:M23 family metallopeptidase [Paenibacillus sp. J22TS3]GIP20735.1 peptidase M24 [Paenibacillus sp. J22TS3]